VSAVGIYAGFTKNIYVYFEMTVQQLQIQPNRAYLFLGHLLRDDLIIPVKMSVCRSVRTSVCTSTIKLNAATNQIVIFVRVDESFTTI